MAIAPYRISTPVSRSKPATQKVPAQTRMPSQAAPAYSTAFQQASEYQSPGLAGFAPDPSAPSNAYMDPSPLGGAGREQTQRRLLGAFSQLFPSGRPIEIQDVPLIETNLNFQNLMRAEQDRAQGINILGQAGMALGNDPQSILAKELATGFATGARGPYSDDQVAMRESAIREQGAVDTRAATQGLQEQLAMRNLGGQAPALETALLEAEGRRATQQALGSFAEQVAQAQAESQLAGLSQLSTLMTQEDALRQAALQALADAFLQTERAPIDLSALTTRPSKGGKNIGT